MTALEYLLNLRDALPMSSERPCTYASNSEIRRWIKQGVIMFNTERITFDEKIDFPVFSLVIFPSSKRRTTLV
jgi:hypothetical protein